jgi:hypothetical protein
MISATMESPFCGFSPGEAPAGDGQPKVFHSTGGRGSKGSHSLSLSLSLSARYYVSSHRATRATVRVVTLRKARLLGNARQTGRRRARAAGAARKGRGGVGKREARARSRRRPSLLRSARLSDVGDMLLRPRRPGRTRASAHGKDARPCRRPRPPATLVYPLPTRCPPSRAPWPPPNPTLALARLLMDSEMDAFRLLMPHFCPAPALFSSAPFPYFHPPSTRPVPFFLLSFCFPRFAFPCLL